jgi:glutamate-1-semialdehyde 2,1-aminomutase/spore coat polysaccharide biosynthesis protein SpsF
MQLRPSTFTRSDDYWHRAQGLIPAGTQTLSKGPTQFVEGLSPKYLQRGQGSHVWDVDGNEYLDYPMGLGPVILGHAHPAVNEAVIKQVNEGSTFTHMHPLEVEVGELIRELVPGVEMIRYGKNGSDATTGAVRCARAYTKRDKIASCGYHSWHDWYVAGTSRSHGVPEWNAEQILKFPYNDLEALEALFEAHPGQIALVIMEPVTLIPPQPGYLEAVKEMAHRHGAVLCFDEIITGFRWGLGGAGAYFGVEPDLMTFGKAMSNGYPLSAIAGKAEFMRMFEDIFMSGTYGGEVISLAASHATLRFMQQNPVIEHLWATGEKLQTGYNQRVAELGLADYTGCIGMHPRTFIQFQDPQGKITPLHLKSLFQQEVVKRGILFNGNHMVTYSHSQADVDYTLAVYGEALGVLAAALDSSKPFSDFLEGRPIQPIW